MATPGVSGLSASLSYWGWPALVGALFFMTFGPGTGLAIIIYAISFLLGCSDLSFLATETERKAREPSSRKPLPCPQVFAGGAVWAVLILLCSNAVPVAMATASTDGSAQEGANFASDHLSHHQAGDALPNCSRVESRRARAVLARVFDPLFDYRRMTIPHGCPLNSPHSVYWHHESVSHRVASSRGSQQESQEEDKDGGRWMCGVCGRSFHGRSSLDEHLSEHHSASLHDKGPCLADYCDVLRCGAFAGDAPPPGWTCDESNMVGLRERCAEAVALCVPGEQSGFGDKRRGEMSKALDAALCRSLTCDTYWSGPPPVRDPGVDERMAAVSRFRFWMTAAAIALVTVFVLLLYCVGRAAQKTEAETADFIREINESEDAITKVYRGDEEYVRQRVNT